MRVGFHGCFHRTGFPYGHFNGETVKDQIHEPDEHTSERVVSPAGSPRCPRTAWRGIGVGENDSPSCFSSGYGGNAQ